MPELLTARQQTLSVRLHQKLLTVLIMYVVVTCWSEMPLMLCFIIATGSTEFAVCEKERRKGMGSVRRLLSLVHIIRQLSRNIPDHVPPDSIK